ncbi:MAG: 3-deoxy-D-manno-octulosonic acid transferase [Caldimonas sp.]
MSEGVGARMARAAYSTLLCVIAPLYALRVLRRGRTEPLYAEHLGERFGVYRAPSAGGALWIHAVSLGETRAAGALIAALRDAIPGLRIVLTNGTATGRAAARELVRDGDEQAWLPVDTPGAVQRFLRHFRPVAGVLMETEIWPNLLAQARVARLPVVLANARLSERSRRRGARVDLVMRPAFESLALVLAQSMEDAKRLREAGAVDVRIVGNLKFDITPEPSLQAMGRRWKEIAGRAVVLAAITREGEEALLLAAWRGVAAPRPLLAIVPRHPQRFDAVAELVVASGFSLSRRSSWDSEPPPTAASADVWLGDSMMEMPAYYALADVALLGGSFLPFGGQNLIEAAACGCPVVMGPHTFNFADAAALSLAAGASVRVGSIDEGVAVAIGALGSESLATQAEAALGFAASHQGAAKRSAEVVAALVRSAEARPA